MVKCINCGDDILIFDPPRYDVFGSDPTLGPFCATCFATTATGKLIAGRPSPDTLDPEEG